MPIDKAAPTTHEFTLALDGIDEIDTALEDALFEAGCDDASLCMTKGQAYLEFDREAPSFDEAVRSALADVRKAGLAVRRVEAEDAQAAAGLSALNCVLELHRHAEADPRHVEAAIRAAGWPAPFSAPSSAA